MKIVFPYDGQVKYIQLWKFTLPRHHPVGSIQAVVLEKCVEIIIIIWKKFQYP